MLGCDPGTTSQAVAGELAGADGATDRLRIYGELSRCTLYGQKNTVTKAGRHRMPRLVMGGGGEC